MIEHYRSLASAPAVYPMTPPALFGMGRRNKVHYGMDAAVVEEMGRAIREIGRELQLEVIDVYAATVDHPEAFRFDGVHPGTAGASLIARAAFDVVAGRQVSTV
jgi:lysophospholipase L1-like esterase